MLPAPVHIVWEADACDSRATFENELHARAPDAEITSDENARAVRLSIAREDSSLRGTATVGASDPREVRAPTCEETIAALALVVALSIAPENQPPPTPTPKPPVKNPPPPSPPPPPTQKNERSFYSKSVLFSLGFSGFLESADAFVGGGRVMFEARREGYALRTSLSFAPFLVRANLGESWFFYTTLRVDACALRFGARLYAQPCLGVEGGALTADPRHVVNAQPAIEPAIFVGPTARVGFWIATRIAVEASFDFSFAGVRHTFVFQADGSTVYRSPAFVARPSLGILIAL